VASGREYEVFQTVIKRNPHTAVKPQQNWESTDCWYMERQNFIPSWEARITEERARQTAL